MQRWEDRIAARTLRVAQRFLNLELHVSLHLRVVESGKRWGVLLEKEIPLKPVGKENEIARTWSECTMLVDSVKLVDSPESKVSTFVWFQEIESFYRLWLDTVYKCIPTGFVTSETLRNWKCVPAGNLTACNHEHMTHQMIQSGAEIVGDVSDSGRDIRRATDCVQKTVSNGKSPREADIDTIRRALRFLVVSLSDHNCSALYSQNVSCQITEMFAGSLNFYADQNDSFVGRKQRELLSRL